MAWFELLSTGIILGGVAFYCWAVYGAGRADLPAASAVASAWRTASAF